MTSAAEWLTALSAFGTFIVIAASAVAAMLQLRHLRSSNQIAAYNECRETVETQAFRDAITFIRTELPARLEQQEAADEMVRNALGGEYSAIRLVANLFETMGLFVKTGMIEERLACELWSGIVLEIWLRLRPVTKMIRERIDPGIWINFEYMAYLSQRYNDRFPDGEYPAGASRMPLTESTANINT